MIESNGLDDNKDIDYLNGYLMFIKNIFLYDFENLNITAIDNAILALNEYKDTLSNKALQKSKQYFISQGFSGFPALNE